MRCENITLHHSAWNDGVCTLGTQENFVYRRGHVIYMSGYTPGFLDEPIPADASFLQKPFRFASLIEQLKLVPRKV
ncbi:MAG TPA: hypothetical protein VGH37_15200 [Candidatus Acidoferrum sp.]|jgi:hypothetical protein